MASFADFQGEVELPLDFYPCCWSVFPSPVPAERYLPGPVVDHDLRAPPLLLSKQVVPPQASAQPVILQEQTGLHPEYSCWY
ncbi:MAG: hypothetical protein N2A40_07330 [Desulfobulbaceae bacterium]